MNKLGNRSIACLGTSDPYVKFKVDGKTCYRSRTIMKNLNPKWDEKFTLMLEDLSKTIDVRVYDYDRGLRDDWMGSAAIEPSQLPLNASVYSGFVSWHTFSDYSFLSAYREDNKLAK